MDLVVIHCFWMGQQDAPVPQAHVLPDHPVYLKDPERQEGEQGVKQSVSGYNPGDNQIVLKWQVLPIKKDLSD
ncbi:hypothetical protein G6F43_013032 [Rhizopus delemar]|nr:hypothetical protein G6F43_013032 [Rhizopus delemar]